MNISDSNINLNISTHNNTGIKVSAPTKSDGGTVSANAQISLAKEGQIFKGQILDITNNKVSIMLDNSKTLHAQMLDAVNMNIGDSLTFMVKENNGSNILIKPYGDGVQNMKDNAIFKILDANSISPTEKNYRIAESLMNNNMPVDKASMQKVMQQVYKFPDASIDTIVNLNRIGMPVTDVNISQYESYLTNSHQLSRDISNLSNTIVDFSKEAVNQTLNQMGVTAESGIEQITNFNSKLISIFSDNVDVANFDSNDIIQLQQLTVQEENVADITNFDISSDINGKFEALANKLNIGTDKLEGLSNELKNAGVSEPIINDILDKSETTMQLLNNINKVISNGDNLNITYDSINNILSGESYNEVLSESIKEKLSLNPKDMENPKEVDDLYRSMYDKTSKLMEAFSSGANTQSGENMSQAAKSMQQRIDFMQNLNNMFAYAQLPVKLDSNQMNSDLYVYMNKRNVKNSKEEVSALLHLDMDHLGATDVHVSLHGTNVHTRFYVEDEVSAKIIDEHMTMLEKAINENGFKLTNEVITREPTLATDSNMVIKEMLGDDLEKSVKRYSFDVRM